MNPLAAGRVVAVVGATATGKSALAIDLALALGGEVVNADASQLYAGMDVGTAKLTEDERRGVPHHLLDVLHVREPASVAAYQRDARAAFGEIAGRGAVPVLVGGSGLYVRAALDRLDFPPTDAGVRAALETELEDGGASALHARLAAGDPEAARSIAASNTRRVVRALEVITLTGRPFSASMPERGRYAVDAVQVGLRLDRGRLVARIEARVGAMRERGLTAEVTALAETGLREGTTARRALGYAQVLDHLDGSSTEDEAYAATVVATRRYAKRQVQWFRPDHRITWVDAAAADPSRHLDEALSALGRAT